MSFYWRILLNRSLLEGDSSFIKLKAFLFWSNDAPLNMFVISSAFALIKRVIIVELKFFELIELILLGAQIEFVTKPLLKIAPSFANLSILGVLFKLWP